MRNQADVIRARANRRHFITTNTMHWIARFDHFALYRILDRAAWDNYIPDGHFVWADNALLHDAVRGYRSKNFWVMVENDTYRSASSLRAHLADAVSKNGNLLLNVGPTSDGSIPAQAEAALPDIGAWLKTNGEAICGSRPWVLHGEGPSNTGTGKKREVVDRVYSPAGLRFTTKARRCTPSGLPMQTTEVLMKTGYEGSPHLKRSVSHVRLLGSAKPVT